MRITMNELKDDIKQLDKKVSLVSYKASELGEKLDRTNAILEGDKEHYIEGLVDKVARHETLFDQAKDFPFDTLKNFVTNWNFIKATIVLIGVGNAMYIIQTVAKAVLAK